MRAVHVSLFLALAAVSALADFSYKHETKIIGGAMAGPMNMAMRMSKQAREAMNGVTFIKGNRMATRNGDAVVIYDLDAETIVNIDHNKREYSTITFAEMQQALARMSEKMSSKQSDVELQYRVKVLDGNKSQSIEGYPAKLTALVVSIESSDKKGNSGAMEMVNDMWLSTSVAGAAELSAFQQRLGEKLAGAGGPGMGMMAGMMKQKGFEQAMKEFQANASRLQGVPVLMVMRMAQAGNLDGVMAESGKIPEEKPEGAEESKPSMGSVLRGMGGLGGFGRKKQAEPESQPQPGGGAATLMEMAMRQFDFSTAPVEDSQFAVPSGYRQVESPMTKALR